MEETEPTVEMERHRKVTGATNDGVEIPQLNISGLKPKRNALISSMGDKKLDISRLQETAPPFNKRQCGHRTLWEELAGHPLGQGRRMAGGFPS